MTNTSQYKKNYSAYLIRGSQKLVKRIRLPGGDKKFLSILWEVFRDSALNWQKLKYIQLANKAGDIFYTIHFQIISIETAR